MIASRLLSILLTLQARGRATAAELARTFEVSVRTIYRDIDELSAAGVPVYAEKGRYGGFRLLDGYRTRLTGLDRPEAEALFLAGLPGAAAQLGLGEALASMRLKLLAALPEAARADAERIAGRFHLDPVAWFRRPEEQAVLPDVALAVWQGRRVRMRYDSWNGEVERDVLPLGVVLKAGAWYMVARAPRREGRDQPRTYRVASILSLAVGEPDPEPREPFDLAAHWAAFSAGYEARMQAERARVRVSPDGVRRLCRLSAAMAEALDAAGPPDAAGWREAMIPIESVAHAVTELLPIGARLEVLEPPALRAAMAEAAQAMSALYA
jgi:predicted DNA-binding transcriptional regulator YafY